ncbi:MAG: hypothetical protein ACR2RF_23100 [Geminicoccaceae bacterium]
MLKTSFEHRHASSMSWIDWVIFAAGCLAWVFALGSLAVLLIMVGD